jgi:TolA-binding protein
MGPFMQTPRAKPPGFYFIGILLLVTFTGCAYYNTFYLARRYYHDAQKAQERSVNDAPSPDAAQKYDATIRQCAKILVDYPKSKWIDDAIYYMGAAMYGKGDYLNAIKKFGELRENVPKSPFVPDSKLMEALSHYRRKEYIEAETGFKEVEAQYPDFKRKYELYYYGAECEVGLRNYPAALAWYGRAVKEAKKKRQKADALRRTGDALYASAKYDSAQVVYADCLKAEEGGSRRLDLALKRGDALEQLKRYDEALKWYDSWKPFALNESREGELSIRIYRILSVLGRANEAVAGYRALVTRYPHTPIAYEAQFRLGYLYESQLGDFDSAGREYDLLKQEPGYSEFQVQASRRSGNLATIKKYRQTLLGDSTQARARAAFLLAEIYYFQIEKADSAMTQYSHVERDFPESPYAPKAAFARLWINTHDRADTAAAAALTDSIASRYRKTRYAESALYLWRRWSGRTDERTALLDSMIAHPDTALARERAADLLEPTITPAAIDSMRTPQSPEQMTPAEQARRDSLAAYTRALYKAQREGKPPPPPLPPRNVSRPADADTAQTKPPAVLPFEPDDADTSDTETETPADTTSTPRIGPSR